MEKRRANISKRHEKSNPGNGHISTQKKKKKTNSKGRQGKKTCVGRRADPNELNSTTFKRKKGAKEGEVEAGQVGWGQEGIKKLGGGSKKVPKGKGGGSDG